MHFNGPLTINVRSESVFFMVPIMKAIRATAKEAKRWLAKRSLTDTGKLLGCIQGSRLL